MSETYLGLDVGGTNVRLATWTERQAGALEDVPRTVANAPLPDGYEAFIQLVEQMVRPYSAHAVGVGLPGVAFDQDVEWLPNAPFLEGGRMAADIGMLSGAPVFCSNDAHAALLGESHFGAARQAGTALLLSVGTGVGGGVLLDGRIYRGSSGSAGSFGWLNLGLEQLHHPEHGQLELVASGTALTERARELGLEPRELISAARAGDERAAGIVAEVATHLGTALATLVSIFDPELVLLSGGLSAEFDLLSTRIREVIARQASPSGRKVPVRAARFGPEAGAMGAVVLGREGRAAFL